MKRREKWIIVRKWDEFQHPDALRNKDGIPPWIRSYTALLHKDEYLELSLHARGVLHGLWLEYAASHQQLTDNTARLSRRLGQKVTRATLDSLIHAGFVEVSASRPQAERKQTASELQDQKRGEEKKSRKASSSTTRSEPRPPDADAVSENGAAPAEVVVGPPSNSEAYRLAEKWVRSEGWHLDTTQLGSRFLFDFGIRESDDVRHLFAIAKAEREKAGA
jgi:hypothetical protein